MVVLGVEVEWSAWRWRTRFVDQGLEGRVLVGGEPERDVVGVPHTLPLPVLL
jgi:hypothetical protein